MLSAKLGIIRISLLASTDSATMSSSDRDYVAMGRHRTAAPYSAVVTILLTVLLGVGVHSTKESLAPAEPALEALGVGPLLYALITVAPTAMSFLTPMFWGSLWDRNANAALIGAPFGELLGTSLIALGLHLFVKGGGGGGAGAIVIGGVIMSSACRAGVSIAEFSSLGESVAVGETPGDGSIGFACLTIAKHLNGIVMAWSVPLLIGSTQHEINGVLRVQLVTLIPHTISLMAGVVMATKLGGRTVGRDAEPTSQRGIGSKQRGGSHRPSAANGPSRPAEGAYSPPALPPAAMTHKRTRRASREAMVMAGAAAPGAFVHVPEGYVSLAELDHGSDWPNLTAASAEIEVEATVEAAQGLVEAAQHAAHGALHSALHSGRQLLGHEPQLGDVATTPVTDAVPALAPVGSSRPPSSLASADASVAAAPPASHPWSVPTQHWSVILLLGGWRALAVGTLHSYHSVRIELVMQISTRLSLREAGALMASTDAAAMGLLACLCLLPRLTGQEVPLRPLLVWIPLLSLAAMAILLCYCKGEVIGWPSEAALASNSTDVEASNSTGLATTRASAAPAVVLGHASKDLGLNLGLRADVWAGLVNGSAAAATLPAAAAGLSPPVPPPGLPTTSHGIGPGLVARASLLVLSSIEIVAPIVPLALVPAAAVRRADGTLLQSP